jgi:hypothetical protein
MRRITLVLTLAVLAALGLAPTTAAASSGYSYKILDNACYGSGHNSVWIKVKEVAAGTTPANKLIFKARAQEFRHHRWNNIYYWDNTVYTFTPDGTNHFLKQWRAWEPSAKKAKHDHRIVVTLVIKHNRKLLAEQVIRSVVC